MKKTSTDKLKKKVEDAQYSLDLAKIALRYEADTPAKKEKLKKRVAAWEDKLKTAKTALKDAKAQESAIKKAKKEEETQQKQLDKLRKEAYTVTKKQKTEQKNTNITRLETLETSLREARVEGENTNTIGISQEALETALKAVEEEKKHVKQEGRLRSYVVTYTHLFRFDSDSNQYANGPKKSQDARIGDIIQTTGQIMAYNGLVDSWRFQPIYGELTYTALFRGEALRGLDGSLLVPVRQKGLDDKQQSHYARLIKQGRRQEAMTFYNDVRGKK